MKNTSQYKSTDIKSFYLDIWKNIEVPISADDEEITITPEFEERPDLLSYRLYGSPNFWWVFALRNKDILYDPIYDFKAGTKIFVVSKTVVESL